MQKHRATDSERRRRAPSAVLVCLVFAAAAVLPSTAHSSTVGMFIGNTTDPLKRIYVSDQLQCQVLRDGPGWNQRAFHPHLNPYDTACATFLDAGGVTYGPTPPIPLATTFNPPVTPYSAGTQTVTHAGSVQCIQTTVKAGSDFVLEQGVCYISGNTFFETSLEIRNNDSVARTVRVSRAANCNVRSLTVGRGATVGFKRVYCTRIGSTSTATGNSIGFIPTNNLGVPLTAGPTIRFMENAQHLIWPLVNGAFFTNTVKSTTDHDNGMGLGATLTIPANNSVTVSTRTTF